MHPSICIIIILSISSFATTFCQTYTVTDTGQRICFDDEGRYSEDRSRCPKTGKGFYGQDAQYTRNEPSFKKLRAALTSIDSKYKPLVLDNNTGLTWMPDLVHDGRGNPRRVTFAQAKKLVDKLNKEKYGGYADWRFPTVKELYSLIEFNGSSSSRTPQPYIDTDYFEFVYGDPDADGKDEPSEAGAPYRAIDAQCWSSTVYTGKIFGRFEAAFGVNFADGRIKGYPTTALGHSGEQAKHFLRCVRGNSRYGNNRFVDNGDNTITDKATGLMWTKFDSNEKEMFGTGKATMDWEKALKVSENLEYAGYNDWRLPNAKELQSIVDYSRSPQHSNPSKRGPAIDPVFSTPNESAWYWTSTTHMDDKDGKGTFGVYVCFGEATNKDGVDVHGAGAQRSDPKSKAVTETKWLTDGFGPQEDEVRVHNYVRCVRTIDIRRERVRRRGQ